MRVRLHELTDGRDALWVERDDRAREFALGFRREGRR
jgi:hypothetical protein